MSLSLRKTDDSRQHGIGALATSGPLSEVQKRFGSRENLIATLADLMKGPGETNAAVAERIGSVSNKKLLRLYDVEQQVRTRFGSREKLIKALVAARKQAGLPIDGHHARLSKLSNAKLLSFSHAATSNGTLRSLPPTTSTSPASNLFGGGMSNVVQRLAKPVGAVLLGVLVGVGGMFYSGIGPFDHDVTLTWTAPTTLVDEDGDGIGEPFRDFDGDGIIDVVSGYVLYRGDQSRTTPGKENYDERRDIGMPSCADNGLGKTTCTYEWTDLEPGKTHYFAADAYITPSRQLSNPQPNKVSSEHSNEVAKSIY